MKPQIVVRSSRWVAYALVPLVATGSACAALSGLADFTRGECELQPCGLDANDGRDASIDGEVGDEAGDGDRPAPREEHTCGPFVCTNNQVCCAPAEGGPLVCTFPCVGLTIRCDRDRQCDEGQVCCGLQSALTREPLDTVACVTPSYCGANVACDDAHPCDGDGGCTAASASPGSPRLCGLAR